MATEQTIFVKGGIAILIKNPSFCLVIKCIQQDEATTRIERTRFESNIHNTLSPKVQKKKNTLQDKLYKRM